LEVIGRSPSDAQPVFDTIVEQAVRLWEAALGFVLRFDGRSCVAAHYIRCLCSRVDKVIFTLQDHVTAAPIRQWT
jgi:hypothetical protein